VELGLRRVLAFNIPNPAFIELEPISRTNILSDETCILGPAGVADGVGAVAAVEEGLGKGEEKVKHKCEYRGRSMG